MKRYKRALWLDDIDLFIPVMKNLYRYDDNMIVIVYDGMYVVVAYDEKKGYWVSK